MALAKSLRRFGHLCYFLRCRLAQLRVTAVYSSDSQFLGIISKAVKQKVNKSKRAGQLFNSGDFTF